VKVAAPTIITLAALVLVSTAPSATTARTTRVSLSTSQQQGDRPSWTAGVSANGRFVAFTSQATDLVPGDTNDRQDAFVIDRKNGRTQRVSVSTSGAQAKAGPNPDGGSAALGISANGRYVLFRSDASNLVPGDTNGKMDAFVCDRATGKTRRIPPAGPGVYAGALSANGRYAVLQADENVYRYDLRRRHLLPLTAGANGWSEEPSVSAHGRYVAFTSIASNLVRGDTTGEDGDARARHRDLLIRSASGRRTASRSPAVTPAVTAACSRPRRTISMGCSSNLAPFSL